MYLLIDRKALTAFYFLRLARGRGYYLAEPPILGILVVRVDARLEELAGLVVDASLGHEIGIDGWCSPGFSGHKHGKATIRRVVSNAHDLALSEVVGNWRGRYPMK